jgi:cytoskeletal protein CcmA (bactofilin family)
MLGRRDDGNSHARERDRDRDKDPANPHTILGEEAKFAGTLNFEGAVRIDGKFEGEIFTDDLLVVGATAEIRAQVNVGTVIIHGLVEGDVTAKTSVEIKSPGRLRGNIVTPALIIEKGVVFDGTCRMSPERKGEVVPIAPPSRPAPASK